MSCINHECKCGELWFNNTPIDFCRNCGELNRGEFDEWISDYIQDEVADIEEGEENE